MATDLFDLLGENEVPPPPAEFDLRFHDRLNQTLVTMHFVDLCIRCLPWCLMHFGQAVIGFFRFTLTGSYHRRRPRRPESS